MSFLLTIEGAIGAGALIAFGVGLALPMKKTGCLTLLAIPIGMDAYVAWWQGQHPEAIRSTSGLDFMFGPLWPSIGAIPGYLLGSLVGERLQKLRDEE